MNIPVLLSLPSCGKCQILKSKLEASGIQFEAIEDVAKMRELGFSGGIPVLLLDNKKLNYLEALEYIKRI